MEQLTEQQRKFYSERIGKVYGVWKVIDITYDRQNNKQLWTLECIHCGDTKTVYHKNFLKTAMWCSCQRAKKTPIVKEKHIYNNDKSYIGKIYGNDKVIGFKKTSGKDSYQWICECQLCHKTHLREPSKLRNGTSPKCKCQVLSYDNTYVGRKFGRLTVIGYGKGHHFICQCECGAVKEYVNKNVIDGSVVSCGCYSDEIKSVISVTHGDARPQGKYRRIYRIYRGMISRCYNTANEKYIDYGGRGIGICDEWRYNYIAFRDWSITNSYTDNLSIDRINNDGGYSPSNCRWTTCDVQANNRRKPKKYESGLKWNINGVTKLARDWCGEYGVSMQMAQYRIKIKGMAPYDALTTDKFADGRPKKN